MENYVNKDSKHYTITQEGLQMLRELDSKSSSSPTYKTHEVPFGVSEAQIGRNVKQIGPVGAFISEYSSVFVLGLVIILVPVGLFENFHIIFPNLSTAAKMIANATMISSLSIAALLSISFVVMLKRQILPNGYRGIMLSALTVLAVLVVNILIFSGLGTQIGMSSSLSIAAKMIANATMISSLSIAALLSISFVVMLKRQILPNGYRGIMLSALTVLAVLVVNILIFSGLGTQIGMSSFTF
jgi:hypothetical protein